MTGMLSDKVVLVTGAGGEIGQASAILFAQEGARVIATDINLESAQKTIEQLRIRGFHGHSFELDISNRKQVASAMNRICEEFGRIDAAFNNAGVNLVADADWDLEAFEKTMDLNTKGTMYCMTAEAEAMRRTGGGAIVNNSSVMGLVGSTRQPGYSASKHAIIGLTRTAALRWAKEGIRVNAVCPGPVMTKMTKASMEHSPEIRQRILSMSPTGRLAEPHEVSEAALWLCSSRSSFINGIALPVDGGFTAG